jgi:hypothetical protein
MHKVQRAIAVAIPIAQTQFSRLLQRSIVLTGRLQTSSVWAFNRGRTILTGPVRNALLVGREFAILVGRERQIQSPTLDLWNVAKSEYLSIWDKILPPAMRQTGQYMPALRTTLGHLTWKQVGGGTLIAAEILSFYYMSKLAVLSSKKTIQAIL